MLSKVFKRETSPQTTEHALGFDWRQYIVFIAFLAIFAFFAVVLYDSGFLSFNNLLNVVRQSAIIAVMAVAMTFVISAAEIDLSVGSVAGLASVLSALAVSEYGLFAGIAAGVLTGLVVGSINGALVAAVRIPSFLVTLGMLGIAVGAARWITDSAPVPILDDAFNNIFGTGQIGPIPSLLIWLGVFLAAGHFILRQNAA